MTSASESRLVLSALQLQPGAEPAQWCLLTQCVPSSLGIFRLLIYCMSSPTGGPCANSSAKLTFPSTSYVPLCHSFLDAAACRHARCVPWHPCSYLTASNPNTWMRECITRHCAPAHAHRRSPEPSTLAAPALSHCVARSFRRRRPRNPCASILSLPPNHPHSCTCVRHQQRTIHLAEQSMRIMVRCFAFPSLRISLVCALTATPSRFPAYLIVFAQRKLFGYCFICKRIANKSFLL
jgi:hypothetical protein